MLFKTVKSAWVVFLSVVLLGCAPKHFGYQLHSSTNEEATKFALVVHSVNDFAVKIYSINGKDTQGIIKTNSVKPTYLEFIPGEYELGVGLQKGFGPCGRVNIVYTKPAVLNIEVEAGKVYLIQRRAQFNSSILCDNKDDSIQVEFYLSELPALPYEDVRANFIEIDLKALPVNEKRGSEFRPL